MTDEDLTPRNYDTRPQVVTPQMHYDLKRRVDGLERRIGSAEMVVHEIAESNRLLRDQITKWLNDVLNDFDSITKVLGALKEGHNKLYHAVCFVGFILFCGFVVLSLIYLAK